MWYGCLSLQFLDPNNSPDKLWTLDPHGHVCDQENQFVFHWEMIMLLLKI